MKGWYWATPEKTLPQIKEYPPLTNRTKKTKLKTVNPNIRPLLNGVKKIRLSFDGIEIQMFEQGRPCVGVRVPGFPDCNKPYF